MRVRRGTPVHSDIPREHDEGIRDRLEIPYGSLRSPRLRGEHTRSRCRRKRPASQEERRRTLTLRSGTDNNLAHINIGRLLNRERNSAGDRIR
jgi:hypothetical protein